jgi:hypothetical protein
MKRLPKSLVYREFEYHSLQHNRTLLRELETNQSEITQPELDDPFKLPTQFYSLLKKIRLVMIPSICRVSRLLRLRRQYHCSLRFEELG